MPANLSRLSRGVLEVASAGSFCAVDVVLFSRLANPDQVAQADAAPQAAVLAYAVAGFAVLPWRRSYPLAVFAALWTHAVVASQLPLLGYHPTVGPLVALYSVALLCSPVRSVLAMLATLVPAGLGVADEVSRAAADERARTLVANSIFFVAVGFGVWGLGRWVAMSHERARDLALRQQAAAREAINAERGRIARELHDIVAHAVTVMVLQAGGAQQVLRVDADRASEALDQVEELGRQAMAELRRLLAVLRAGEHDDGPGSDGRQPGLHELEELLRTFREAALPVRLEVSGHSRRIDRSVDLAAYRTVQEALTNVLKHAGPGTLATVELGWADDVLHVRVADLGGKEPRHTTLSTGHGLLGLHERVSIAGGSLHAGPSANGGFEVSAALPVAAGDP